MGGMIASTRKSMAKKIRDSDKCLECGAKFVKLSKDRVKLYCETHFMQAKKLRGLRQPCRRVSCVEIPPRRTVTVTRTDLLLRIMCRFVTTGCRVKRS